jgi:hypothetical protein
MKPIVTEIPFPGTTEQGSTVHGQSWMNLIEPKEAVIMRVREGD